MSYPIGLSYDDLISFIMADYPAMTRAVAERYAREVLGATKR